MNILFICTSNKDRSPALQRHFQDHYPQHTYQSAGVNKYYTAQKFTHYLESDDLFAADLIVYCETIHFIIVHRDFPAAISTCMHQKVLNSIILNAGGYEPGNTTEYIKRAEQILVDALPALKIR